MPVSPLPLYVDVSVLRARHLTGIARFTARLLEALSRRRPLRLFTLSDATRTRPTPRREIAVDAPLPSADADVQRWCRALLRRRWRAPAADAHRHACLYTLYRPPARLFAREISILYDFTPLLLPACHVPATRHTLGHFFSTALPRSDGAVAISHSTRHDATWLCDLPAGAVVTAYPGPSLCTRQHAGPRAVSAQADRILVVSTREPRKNAAFVLDWFLRSPHLAADAELWWVGPVGWLWRSPRPPAGRFPRRRYRFLGHLSDHRLCELYRRADCSVYASLYEGFGFPVLDSLWHGTPVLTSFNSSLKEFSAAGVFHFDPGDRNALDDAYRRMRAAAPQIIDRAALEAAYSWDRLADTVSALASAAR
jgi:glycosyltransferase involved in cell wall biosynthesis